MSRVLIVEDEKGLLESLSSYLSREGFEVSSVRDVKSARCLSGDFADAVILDWRLPDGEGIEILREWRKRGLTIPILMLTARNDLVDKVVGLELGADDYLTKPFEPRELIARIRAQMRRRRSSESHRESNISQGGIEMNISTRQVFYKNREIGLAKMEFDLLRLFLENPRQAFSREEILNRVWGFENYPTTRTIDTHVLQLRQKFCPSYFETVRGIGYRFRGEEN